MKLAKRKAYVIATGVKNRCRKTSREMIKLGTFPENADKNEVMALAYDRAQSYMKVIQSASLHWDYVTIETNSGGYDMESWLMFDERHEKLPMLFSA